MKRSYTIFFWVYRDALEDRHGRRLLHNEPHELTPDDILELAERAEVWPCLRDGKWYLFIDRKGCRWQQR